MSIKSTPGIHLDAIAKVMQSVLPQLSKLDHARDDARESLDALISENERLGDAFYKSSYAARHLDWEYAVELIYAVLEAEKFKDAHGFAKELDVAVKATAAQRDYVIVLPLGFARQFGYSHQKKDGIRSFAVGDFWMTPPVANADALNRLLKPLQAHPVQKDLFAHQVTQSHKALSTHPLVVFEAHGSFDSLRRQVHPGVRRLIGLVELFGRVFDADRAIFGNDAVSNHIFLANKRTGSLDRIPTRQSLTVSLPLTRSLVKAIRRPEVAKFIELLSSGSEKGLVGRLRNALEFFGRAVNESNSLTRFLFFVIAMEAIFSRDKNAPIRITLADYASILCFKGDERRTVHADIRAIYDVRSAIVHNGVTSVDRRMLDKSEALSARAIYCSLLLAINVTDGAGKQEDRFYDRLRDMKIGVESNPIRLPQWRGYSLRGD